MILLDVMREIALANAVLIENGILQKDFMSAQLTDQSSSRKPNHKAAFTRVELLAVLAMMAVLATLALPVLATSSADSQIAQCFNNLRQIGYGVRLWGNDHDNQPPWLTSDFDGGTRPLGGKPGNAWFEYLTLSNQLSTARVLACPADDGVKIASGWGVGPNALGNFAFRADAISYGIGAHCFAERSRGLISADRNVRVTQPVTGCSPTRASDLVGLAINPAVDPNIAWTNGVHKIGGNLLLNDGSVHFVSSAGLRSIISEPASDTSGSLHMFKAR